MATIGVYADSQIMPTNFVQCQLRALGKGISFLVTSA